MGVYRSDQAQLTFAAEFGGQGADAEMIEATVSGSTALLAAEKGITASYCKCFHPDKEHRNPILAPMYEKGGPKNIAFTLSLGYKDPRGVTAKYHNFMNVDEYVSWAKNDRE